MNMKKKPTIAVLMSVRNEENFIDLNISYHLDLGFDYIFIANHCSTDGTNEVLESYKNNPKIVVINETDPVFDHAKIINNLILRTKLSTIYFNLNIIIVFSIRKFVK